LRELLIPKQGFGGGLKGKCESQVIAADVTGIAALRARCKRRLILIL